MSFMSPHRAKSAPPWLVPIGLQCSGPHGTLGIVQRHCAYANVTGQGCATSQGGFGVTVVRDVEAPSDGARDAALAQIVRAGAVFVSAEDVLRRPESH
jgi:hypothetical protein